MKNPCLAAIAVPALAMAFALATACTNDTTAVIPAGTGSVAGGGYGGNGGGVTNGGGSGGGSESPPADAGSGTPAPGTGGDDANAPRPGSEGGTGSGGHQDAGSGSGGFGVDGQVPVIDSGVPSTSGPLGSCGNPACGTDGTECGCQATDSQGNNVQLGCQAGGQCACFVNGNQDTNAFDENGACNSQPATVQQFLQFCTGSCN